MKEITEFGKDKTKIEKIAERNQQQEYKLVGNIRLKTGCKLFVFDREKDSMEEVILLSKATADMNGNPAENKKASYDPTKLYFQAINEKNARRKLKKYDGGEFDIVENFGYKEEYVPLKFY